MKAEEEIASKVDKAEVERLQDQLAAVQDQIQKQKQENEDKIKEQEALIALKLQKEEESAKEKQAKQEEHLLKYSENSSSIKEANEICKLMGKRIKFK